MHVVYLPLDSRPCNYRFPVQLLEMAGVSCTVPPLHMMDHFTRPSDHGQICSFLLEETATADTLIISIDQLVYGSLLASREEAISIESAHSRLGILDSIRKQNPRLRIVAMNVILRSSISTLSKADLPHYEAITAYAQAAHKRTLGDQSAQAAYDALRHSLPPELLAKYHRVRARNHAINRACIACTGDNVIDDLLLLQEDSQEFGLHKIDQIELIRVISGEKYDKSVTIHNGTDEGGCLCAARIVSRPCTLHLCMLGNNHHNFIAKYEDRPFLDNVASHSKFARIALTSTPKADYIMAVLPPPSLPQEDVPVPCAIPPDVSHRLHFYPIIQMNYVILCNPNVALLDVAYANGGDETFMRMFAEQANPLSLCGYAAWNTASNSLGTLLAQIKLAAGHPQNILFTAERLLDDLLYQSNVRFQLQDRLSEIGEDPFHIQNIQAAQQLLQTLMDAAVQTHPVFAHYHIQASYCLPWPRTFEIDVTVNAVDRKK